MTLASHLHFILAAYGAATVILGALILWVMLDYRALKRTLAGFEDEGVTRRSDAARSPL
jgi:heme exporter protein CcmD